MEKLFSHVDALTALCEALDDSLTPPEGHEKCEKRFPDKDNWYWVRITKWGEDRVESPAALSWLNARWRVIERVFQGFDELRPRIRRFGDDKEPRGLEAWEWSCIGLHRLWDGWFDPRGRVRADLRPALFSFDEDDSPEEDLEDYEILYPVENVEAVAGELRDSGEQGGQTAPVALEKATTNDEEPPRWTELLRGCIDRNGFSSTDKPMALLSALKAEGLARKEGSQVILKVSEEEAEALSILDFQKIARQALDEARGEG